MAANYFSDPPTVNPAPRHIVCTSCSACTSCIAQVVARWSKMVTTAAKTTPAAEGRRHPQDTTPRTKVASPTSSPLRTLAFKENLPSPNQLVMAATLLSRGLATSPSARRNQPTSPGTPHRHAPPHADESRHQCINDFMHFATQ